MNLWRLISDLPATGEINMATDEALLKKCCCDDERPVLRFYSWSEATLSLGYLQDSSHFAETSLPLVRRPTGGRAVLHTNEITYSVICGKDSVYFDDGINSSYCKISRAIVGALNDIGIDAELSPGTKVGLKEGREACFYSPSKYEVTVAGRKLVGSAQRRLKGGFLQHGSILISASADMNIKFFGKEVFKNMASLEEFVDVTGALLADFKDALIKRFASSLGATFEKGTLTDSERALRDRLLKEKYGSRMWNLNGKAPVFEGAA